MPDGSVVRTGGRARKSSTGYDLTRLLVGAEGTLGVITEVAVRLHGQPEAVSSAVCEFDSLEGAAQAPCLAPRPAAGNQSAARHESPAELHPPGAPNLHDPHPPGRR